MHELGGIFCSIQVVNWFETISLRESPVTRTMKRFESNNRFSANISVDVGFLAVIILGDDIVGCDRVSRTPTQILQHSSISSLSQQ
jgi:hypothetical protein